MTFSDLQQLQVDSFQCFTRWNLRRAIFSGDRRVFGCFSADEPNGKSNRFELEDIPEGSSRQISSVVFNFGADGFDSLNLALPTRQRTVLGSDQLYWETVLQGQWMDEFAVSWQLHQEWSKVHDSQVRNELNFSFVLKLTFTFQLVFVNGLLAAERCDRLHFLFLQKTVKNLLDTFSFSGSVICSHGNCRLREETRSNSIIHSRVKTNFLC